MKFLERISIKEYLNKQDTYNISLSIYDTPVEEYRDEITNAYEYREDTFGYNSNIEIKEDIILDIY